MLWNIFELRSTLLISNNISDLHSTVALSKMKKVPRKMSKNNFWG